MKNSGLTKNKDKLNKRWINTLQLITLLMFIYIFIFIDNYEYKYIYTLPISYFVFTLVYHYILNKINYKFGIVFIIANLIIFIRFVLTPFSMVFASRYNGIGFGPNPTHSSINYAIILMVLELLMTYVSIILACIHYKNKMGKLSYKNNNTKFFKNKGIIMMFLLLSLPIISIFNPSAIIPKSFSSSNSITFDINTNISGIIQIITIATRTSLILFILSQIKNLYDSNKRIMYIIIAWLSMILYLSTIFSSSRWTLLFTSIILVVLMNKLFPKSPKVFYILFIAIGLIGIAAITINKFSWAFINLENPYKDIVGIIIGQFQEYFSGPRVVAQAIDMREMFKGDIGYITFINDFLGSVPGLAKFVDQSNRINVYFNRYLNIGNISHIIPMLGQGFNYIPFFPVFLTMITEWLMVRFDYKYNTTLDLEFKYIYAYIGFFLAMSMGFNTQIIWGNFITTFIPLWILFTVNRKVAFRKKYLRYDRLESKYDF